MLTTIQEQASKIDVQIRALGILTVKAVNKTRWGEVLWLFPSGALRADNKKLIELGVGGARPDLSAGSSHRSDCHGDLSHYNGCFFKGFLEGQALTMQPHAALKQDDDSQECVPSVPSSQNCHECTLKNMIRADSGGICPHAEGQLCNMDIEGTSCHCLLANCSTAKCGCLGSWEQSLCAQQCSGEGEWSCPVGVSVSMVTRREGAWWW